MGSYGAESDGTENHGTDTYATGPYGKETRLTETYRTESYGTEQKLMVWKPTLRKLVARDTKEWESQESNGISENRGGAWTPLRARRETTEQRWASTATLREPRNLRKLKW